jgi:hypothetical protein
VSQTGVLAGGQLRQLHIKNDAVVVVIVIIIAAAGGGLHLEIMKMVSSCGNFLVVAVVQLLLALERTVPVLPHEFVQAASVQLPFPAGLQLQQGIGQMH